MISILKSWVKLPPWKKIYVALVLGIITGLYFQEDSQVLQPIGNIFIHAIHMTIVPIVFVVIVCAITSMDDFSQMKRVSLKAIIIYGICMLCAACIGIIIASLVKPGQGFPFIDSLQTTIVEAPTAPSLLEMFENLVPRSPVASFVEGNILQIVVFSVLFGISINLSGEKGKQIKEIFKSLSSVVFKLVEIVMTFAPYGIFAFIASTFGAIGIKAFMPLLLFVLTVAVACIFQFIFVYSIVIWFVTGDNILTFLKKASHPLTFAVTTCSSAATLPVSIETVQREWHVPEKFASFLLPLGTSFNLNGLTIYLSVATIFAANIYGIDLNYYDYFTLIITIIVTTMGIAAVPGSAIIAMSVVMSSVGVPLGALGIIIGVDRINDMFQTVTNVAGDIFATVIVSKLER